MARKVPAAFRAWARAAKACRKVGKVGSKTKMACMRRVVKKHRR